MCSLLKAFSEFAFLLNMFERSMIIHWQTLLTPLAEASMAFGRLAHALDATKLHQAWLWREMARSAAKVSQLTGHRVRLERLMLALAGVPLEALEDDAGLAAARRLFLTAAPLFRDGDKVESRNGFGELFEPLWPGGDGGHDDARPDGNGDEGGERKLERLVRDLARQAGSGDRPPLLELLIGLRRQGRMKQAQMRFVLPLAIRQAGLLPKAAPALLGGRLPFLDEEDDRITPWLIRALDELSREAAAAGQRLADLEGQHRAWQGRLSRADLRVHSRLPAVLDLLAVTPVLSASLVARQLGCSPQGAGAMLRQLLELGIVKSATPRARWKIYLAADLALPGENGAEADQPLSFSDPVPAFDREATERLLDRLLFDLECCERRTRAALGDRKD